MSSNSFVRVIGYLSKKSINQIKTKLLPQTENPGRIPLSASASNNNADGLPNLLEDKLARLLLLKSRDQASRVYCLKKRYAVQLGKKVFLLYKLFYSDLFTFQIKKKKN